MGNIFRNTQFGHNSLPKTETSFYVNIETHMIHKFSAERVPQKNWIMVNNDDFDINGKELYFDKNTREVASKVCNFSDSDLRIFRTEAEKIANFNIRPTH